MSFFRRRRSRGFFFFLILSIWVFVQSVGRMSFRCYTRLSPTRRRSGELGATRDGDQRRRRRWDLMRSRRTNDKRGADGSRAGRAGLPATRSVDPGSRWDTRKAERGLADTTGRRCILFRGNFSITSTFILD